MAMLESESQPSQVGNCGGDPVSVDFNKEFQRASVIDYLIIRKPIEQVAHPITVAANLLNLVSSSGYAAYLYNTRDAKEYEDGFGPSLTVRVGDYETVWKRSRNKWNPYEKIGTIPGIDDSDYCVVWDRSRSNAFYVSERLYYYLDRDKHREKFGNIRGKLYITRVVQKTSESGKFLLQFIAEEMEDGQRELDRLSNEKKRKRGSPAAQLESEQPTAAPDVVESGPLRHDADRKIVAADVYLPGIDRILPPYTPGQFTSLPFDGRGALAATPRATSPVHLLPAYSQFMPTPSVAPYPSADHINSGPPRTSSGAVMDPPRPSQTMYNRGIGTLKSSLSDIDGPFGTKAQPYSSSSAGDTTDAEVSRAPKRRAVDIASSALMGLSDAATSLSRSSSPSPSTTTSRPESPVNTQQTNLPQHMLPFQMLHFPIFPNAAPSIGMMMTTGAGPQLFPGGARMMANHPMQFYPASQPHMPTNQAVMQPQYYHQFFAQATMLPKPVMGQAPASPQQSTVFQRSPQSASQ